MIISCCCLIQTRKGAIAGAATQKTRASSYNNNSITALVPQSTDPPVHWFAKSKQTVYNIACRACMHTFTPPSKSKDADKIIHGGLLPIENNDSTRVGCVI
jgi:hypothetical protein